MIVTIKLYAPFSFALGKKELSIEIPGREEVSVHDFLLSLADRERRLQKLAERDHNAFSNATILVNQQTCDSNSLIRDGDQVTFISLVSGG